MARKVIDEFPILRSYGLKLAATKGDGNCLFYSFSDQIYGDHTHHKEIRERVVQEMREHPEDYKPFMDVNPGGGYRRNASRKAKRKNITPIIAALPTQAEIDDFYEKHLVRMAQNGTWGDNHEIRAFSKAYNTDVVIFSNTHINISMPAGEPNMERPRAYIAYYDGEHYDSVRNINGPHTGLPEIQRIDLSGQSGGSNAPRNTIIHDWMVRSVMTALPDIIDEELIKNTLVLHNGNIDNTVTYLMDLQYSSNPPTPGSLSPSPQSGTSSVERDYDSDDDERYGPNKRRNCHPRATEDASMKAEVIPTIELTQPDTDMSIGASAAMSQTTTSDPSQSIGYADSIGASDGDDEYRPENSASEYDASSRATSVDSLPPPRNRVILPAKGTNGSRAYKARENSASPTPPILPGMLPSQYIKSQKKRGPRSTARQLKVEKKAAQKKASTERKRREGSGDSAALLRAATSNLKRDSPPTAQLKQLLVVNA